MLATYEDSNYFRWYFEYLGNNQYYIRSMIDTNYVLYYFSNSGRAVRAYFLEETAEEYVWNVVISEVGGVVITHVSTGLVLQYNGTAVVLGSALSSSDANYRQTVWGIVNQSSYVHLTDFELSDNWLLPSSSKNFSIKEYPEMATWSSESHFTWSFSNSVFTVNDSGRVTSNASGGYDTLTVTHKSTGLTKTFRITSGAVREGTYMILNKDTGRYIEIESETTASGAYIQQGDYHTGTYAKWNVSLLENGEYIFKSVYSNKYLRVEGGSSSSGAKIIQYDDYSWSSCRWRIYQTTSGAYRIVPALVSTFAVSVPLNENADGTDLVQLAYTEDTNYRDEWYFDTIGETVGIGTGKVYHIKAVHSGKGFDVNAAQTANGTFIGQHEIGTGKQWQRWLIKYVGNGDYKIIDMNSGSLLSIYESSYGVAAVHLWEEVNSDGQLFRIQQNTDGTYSFLSKCSRYTKALEIIGGNTENGAGIQQNYRNNENYQKFNLVESVADISFIAPAINLLYQYAVEYAPNTTSTYQKHLVLQYIRKSFYNTSIWELAAGTIDDNFTIYVNNKNEDIPLMFGNPRQPQNGPGNSAGSFIIDLNGESIDFYHLCATLDAMLYSDIYPQMVANADKDLAGWALDLVTTAPDVLNQLSAKNLEANYANVYSEMYSILSTGGENSSFSRADYLADIDSSVIYKTIINMQMESMEDYFEYHYAYNYNNRYSLFGKTYEELSNTADFYLKATPVFTFILANTDRYNNMTNLTTAQREGLRDAFTDYFWECLSNE